jgi:predicted RNase H-like HicB family nuclease
MAFGYRYRLERQENGWWLVRFPAIPQALTEGETPSLVNAKLAVHETMRRRK